jgi:hypothetical protein
MKNNFLAKIFGRHDSLGFELIQCEGKQAVSRLEELRRDWQSGQPYPFLLGDEKSLKYMRENQKFDKRTVEQIIQASLQINTSAWINEQQANFTREQEESPDEEFTAEDLLGDWEETTMEVTAQPAIDPLIQYDMATKQIKPLLYIGLVNLEEPWMLPAQVRFGGWNACPEAALQCALMRYWQEKHGAEIITIAHDVIECKVKNPPATKDEAIKLAWEQFWYCEDIVMQGAGTISDLAAGLINSPYWYFWWD